MSKLVNLTAIGKVLTDVLASPFLLGYIALGLGLIVADGAVVVLGIVMIVVPLLVALYLSFTE